MKSKYLSVSACLCLVLISAKTISAPSTPDSPDAVVASWPNQFVEEPTGDILVKIKWHLQQTGLPGKATNHSRQAEILLNRIRPPNPLFNNEVYAYLRARSLQQTHQFTAALTVLNQLTLTYPDHVNGWLLKASIHLIQGQYKQAKQACTKLAGQVSGVIFTACVLEVAGYSDDLSSVYQQLSGLEPALTSQSPAIRDWIRQTLADQALRLNKAQQAAKWLTTKQLATKPTSFIALWADAHLALGDSRRVAQQLNSILQHSDNYDDALLIRMSLAEKNNLNPKWRQILDQRMQLRIARHDQFHAADLARYFLDINLDPEQAIYWASINWQQAKLHADMQLMERALAYKQERNHG